MHIISRSSQSTFSQWWYAVDRASLVLALVLACIGVIACGLASPAVALRVHLEEFALLKRHLVHVVLAVTLLFAVSFAQHWQIKLVALVGFCALMIAMTYAIFYGADIKGAKRWIYCHGFNMQPSEFLRPCLVVLTAWLLERASRNDRYYVLAVLPCTIASVALACQPDIGMVMMVAAVLGVQLFISRLSVVWVAGAGASLAVCLLLAYLTFGHVRTRIDSFLAVGGSHHDQYQIVKSLEAFSNGGLFGTGPGRGIVRSSIPDSHSDFVLAVVAEEFGMFTCLCIVFSYLFIAISCVLRARACDSEFCRSAAIGLAAQLQLQALINVGVVTRLLPTTGITLPFVSYGGSSMLATGMTVGAMLALTRYRMHRLP
jgi:cell division protein FtsW